MFTRSAELYDIIYRRMKDYEAESRRIHEILTPRCGAPRRILDVACGTGEHARHLAKLFGYEVHGLDLDENLLAIAQAKNPGGRFFRGDMTRFDVGERYDAVLCLFSAIGYARTLDGVRSALSRFREHLRDDGVILVEPWFVPGFLDPGRIFVDDAKGDDLRVVRMAATEVQDRMSFTRFEYLIGRNGRIERASETHELGLFTVDEMMDCFRKAGLEAEYDPEGLSSRGLYVARMASRSPDRT